MPYNRHGGGAAGAAASTASVRFAVPTALVVSTLPDFLSSLCGLLALLQCSAESSSSSKSLSATDSGGGATLARKALVESVLRDVRALAALTPVLPAAAATLGVPPGSGVIAGAPVEEAADAAMTGLRVTRHDHGGQRTAFSAASAAAGASSVGSAATAEPQTASSAGTSPAVCRLVDTAVQGLAASLCLDGRAAAGRIEWTSPLAARAPGGGGMVTSSKHYKLSWLAPAAGAGGSGGGASGSVADTAAGAALAALPLRRELHLGVFLLGAGELTNAVDQIFPT